MRQVVAEQAAELGFPVDKEPEQESSGVAALPVIVLADTGKEVVQDG